MHYECDIPMLETDRLMMRGFLPEDVHPLSEICSDEETMRHLGGVQLPEETSQKHASMIGHWVTRGCGMWAVEEKTSGRFIGRVGLINFHGWPQMEVGWLIGRPWWGRGYAPEAARAAAHWGFQTLDIDGLCSLIDPANRNSIRVAEKLGETPTDKMRLFNTDLIIHRMSRETFYRVNANHLSDH